MKNFKEHLEENLGNAVAAGKKIAKAISKTVTPKPTVTKTGTPSSRLNTKGSAPSRPKMSSRLDTKGFTPQPKSSSSASRARPAKAPRAQTTTTSTRTSSSATRNANKGRTNAPLRGAERKAQFRKDARSIGLLRKSSGPATRGGERAKQYRGTDKEGLKTPTDLSPNRRKSGADHLKRRRLTGIGIGKATDGARKHYFNRMQRQQDAIFGGKAADKNKAFPGAKKQVGDRPSKSDPMSKWKKWWKANGRDDKGRLIKPNQPGSVMGRSWTQPRYNTEEFEDLVFKYLKLDENEGPCWDGYKQVGMKKKNGKEVPNCVPEEVELDEMSTTQQIRRLMLAPKMKKIVRYYLDWRRKNPGQGQQGVQKVIQMLGLRPRDGNQLIDVLNREVEKGNLPKHLAIESVEEINRHGIPKDATKSELKKIRSDEKSSKGAKDLAHWLLNMHHNKKG